VRNTTLEVSQIYCSLVEIQLLGRFLKLNSEILLEILLANDPIQTLLEISLFLFCENFCLKGFFLMNFLKEMALKKKQCFLMGSLHLDCQTLLLLFYYPSYSIAI
jgi:hypothetical protein